MDFEVYEQVKLLLFLLSEFLTKFSTHCFILSQFIVLNCEGIYFIFTAEGF